MSDKGLIYCEKIDSWCAWGLQCDRENCISDKRKAPTEIAVSDVGASQNTQVQSSTDGVSCQEEVAKCIV